jgi:excisionase family DNA binding protein
MTMDNAGNDARPNQSSSSTIAFSERLTCSVAEASEAIGLSRSKIYELISGGAVRSVTIGRRRLVSVPSLQQLTGSPSHGTSEGKQAGVLP